MFKRTIVQTNKLSSNEQISSNGGSSNRYPPWSAKLGTLYIRMSFFIIQSVPYQIGSSLRFKDKTTHIILENPSNFCKKYFEMDLHDFLK